MTLVEPIKVEGLAQFSRDLKRIDGDLAKGLRLAQNEAAAVVVDYVRPQVPTVTGHARSTVKAKSTRTQGRVVGGSARYPYYAWLDFGGKVGRGNSVARPYYGGGRWMYPALDVKRADIYDVLTNALLQLCRQAGVEVDA